MKRGRKKDKKSKKSAMSNKDEEPDIVKESPAVGSDGEDTQKSAPRTPEVDEEGYSKPPPDASKIGIHDSDPWSDFNRHHRNIDSSSDDSGNIRSIYIPIHRF